MNPQESELQFPWRDAPPAGTVTTLRPGVHWLRMPLPFALDHINLWLLEDELEGRRGYTVIDTGIASDATRAAWEAIFDTVFAGLPLLRIVSTHFHPDHFGLAAWLAEGGERRRWQAPVWMTHGEYVLGRMLSQARGDDGAAGDRTAAHFRRHGLSDPASLRKVWERGYGYYAKLVPAAPQSFRRIRDGERIAIGVGAQRRQFDVIVGYGHAPEHASLWCADDSLLVSGDMVLPRISTNVSVHEIEPEGNPLPAYLASLEAMRRLAADTLVLPSHGLPFVGLHERIRQQQEHHALRLAEVVEACGRPLSAAEVVPVLFRRSLDLHQLTFALGESLAHLHALYFEGRLRRIVGEDGVVRFESTGSAPQ